MTGCHRLCLLLLGIAVFLSGCQSNKPIQIGFVGELTGRNAVLGVQARNGAQVAVEEINAAGGINGKPLEMLVYDNAGDQDTLLEANQQLIDRKVIAITGHPTSWEALGALDLLAKENMLLFSPTTSSPKLSARRDNFFRMIPSNTEQAYPLATFLYEERQARRVTVLYESDNAPFTQSYVDAFLKHFSGLGGQMVMKSSYSSTQDPNFAAIVDGLRRAGPTDVLLLVCPSVETALIAQHVNMQGWDVQLATSNWAYTEDLLQNGGRAIEGMLISAQFNSNCHSERYLSFKQVFEERYGESPAFAAVFSYETIQVLARALSKTGGRRAGLEDALIQAGEYDGLCDQTRMDEFGDVQRTLYLISIHDGKFEVVREVPPRS